MRTEAANGLQQHIIDEAKRLRDMATMYALMYAENDDPDQKASFLRYKFAADELQKLHAPTCNFLHALEAMIPKEQANEQ